MRMLDQQSFAPVRFLYHGYFSFIYGLLLIRGAISIYEGGDSIEALNDDWLVTILVKRLAGVVYEPFYAVLFPPMPYSIAYFIKTILLAIAFYSFVHYGIFMKVNEDGAESRMDKLLKFCRAMFFFFGTLLLVLTVLRMSVELYYDFTLPRGQYLLAVPKD